MYWDRREKKNGENNTPSKANMSNIGPRLLNNGSKKKQKPNFLLQLWPE